MKPYNLIRQKDGNTVLEAAYVKHFEGGSYCALMEEYPAAVTRILICRRVSDNAKEYGYRLCRLISHGMGSTDRTIGFYVTMGEARTEQEAQKKISANRSGSAAISQILRGKTK